MADHKALIGRGQDDRKVPQGTGRRIIGQVAGHKIHLEIEDVLDKIKINKSQILRKKLLSQMPGIYTIC